MTVLTCKFFIYISIHGMVLAANYRTKFNDICGRTKRSGKIVGGRNAAIGEFPWIARIGASYPYSEGPFYFCGGSLITDQHILTAEHCFYNVIKEQLVDTLIASLGDHNLNGERACVGKLCSDPPVIYEVAKIVPYNLDESTYQEDITIMRLASKVKFTKWISPLCLPDNIRPNKFIGESMVAIGFGYVDSQKRKYPKMLQKVKIALKPGKECEVFKEYSGPGQICAGSAIKDTCKGDSGGPLIKLLSKENGPQYTQMGIVSFGSKICEDVNPAVFTDVYYYLNWIDEVLNNED